MIDPRIFWASLLGSATGTTAALAIAAALFWWWLAT